MEIGATAIVFGNDGGLISMLDTAIALIRQGEFEKAQQALSKIIHARPRDFDANHMLGVVYSELHKFDLAEKHFLLAESVDSRHPPLYQNYGLFLGKAKRFHEALEKFKIAIQLAPNFAPVYSNRGDVLKELGKVDEAIVDHSRAISLAPGFFGFYNNRGNALKEKREYSGALADYNRAIELNPNYPDAHIGRGNVLCDLKRYDEALDAFGKAHSIKPDLENVWLGRGNVYSGLKRYNEAVAAYDKALSIKPDLENAWLGRGNVLFDLKRYDESVSAYDRALSIEAGLAEAWLGRGNVFSDLRRYDEAVSAYDKALLIKADLPEAWLGRGNVFCNVRRYDEAFAAYDKALAIKPDLAEAWLGRGKALGETNRTREAVSAFDKALSIRPDFADAISNRIFALDFIGELGFAEHQQARAMWWERVGAPLAEDSVRSYANTRDPDRRLKVGYVSADFRQHSAANSFGPVIFNHDRSRFEISCYSTTRPGDGMTVRFQQAVDRWNDVVQISDEELAARIRNDQIDILVDLSGHSAGNRLGVFARKPAPVQVTAWGHATGTGLPTIDYLFSDPVDCPAEARHFFSEKIFDLPCLISIDPLPIGVRLTPPPVLSKGYPTFGVFNRAAKSSEEAVAVWARVLQSTTNSKILFKNSAYDNASVRDQLLELFRLHGISADRVKFAGSTPRVDHLTMFSEVDISLDPFPQNGGVSTWESLQVGVPVVAKLGNSMAGRAGGAIVSAVGLLDWVANSNDDYVAIATKFAGMPDHLKALREELPSRIAQSDAGNSLKYTRAVEAAYRTMWADYCGGTAA